MERFEVDEVCCAKTRAGTPCKSRDLLKGGRCRIHGGASTGPNTLEGRKRAALNIGKDYLELLSVKKARQQLREGVSGLGLGEIFP